MIGVGLIGAGVLAGSRWRLSLRRHAGPSDGDAAAFGRLLIVAMTSGLGLAESWQLAAQFTGGRVGREAIALERKSRATGLAAELLAARGELAPIATSIAQAQLLGAPVIPATRAAVDRIRLETRARRVERIRTLTVKLTLPVSLLLLPGFLIIVVVPYLLDGVGDLFPVLP